VASKLKKPSCFIEIRTGESESFVSARKQMAGRELGQRWRKTLNPAGLAPFRPNRRSLTRQLSLFAGKGARQLWRSPKASTTVLLFPEAPAAKSWSSQETFTEDVTVRIGYWPKTPVHSGSSLRQSVEARAKTVRTSKSGFDITISTIADEAKAWRNRRIWETDCYLCSLTFAQKLAAPSLPPLGFREAVRVYGVVFQSVCRF